MRIDLENLSVGHGERTVLADLDLSIADGSCVALLGPNGCGKSTLLRTIGALAAPQHGRILLDGRDLAAWPRREVAKQLAILPQGPTAPAGLSVRELVLLGRHPHRGLFSRAGAADRSAVEEALAMTGLDALAEQQVQRLSGGERQRVWMALTLAQQAGTLLLDEPTTFLDLGHQLELLELVARLRTELDLTVVMVLHDLNQAARFAERLVVLASPQAPGGTGHLAADGTPAQVLTPALVREVFGVDGEVSRAPDGTPHLVAHASAARGQNAAVA